MLWDCSRSSNSGQKPMICPLTVVILYILCVHSSSAVNLFDFPDSRQAAYASELVGYEISVPRKVNARGEHLTNTLHHVVSRERLRRRKRYLSESDPDPHTLYYQMTIANKTVHIQLVPNYHLVPSAMIVERRTSNYVNITDSVLHTGSSESCHYIGKVIGHKKSSVAIATCHGLMGYILTDHGEYLIEPVKGHDLSRDSRHPHLVYRRSALAQGGSYHDNQHSDGPYCGVKEFNREEKNREIWEKHNSDYKKLHKRRKRSVSLERHIEALIVVDKKMTDYYNQANEDIETYVLTIMNMVSSMYHEASIGNAINIGIIHLLLLEKDEKDLVITHHADNSLQSFCKWQKKMNPKEDHKNHHDVAILLTRYNICSRMNEPCSTLGLAQVSGMCQPHRSCNINEDTGLALAYTVAHELGHNFGMKHDTETLGCDPLKSEQQYIMSPQLTVDTAHLIWSNCSRKSITDFLDRDWGSCLEDEPEELSLKPKSTVLAPGVLYNADHQCRLQYGPEASHCEGIEELCDTLWCKINHRCITRLESAAEGTTCIDDSVPLKPGQKPTPKWCFAGKCTTMGEHPRAINGEWSSWGSWTKCTRSCEGGISHAQRLCNNPPPSHGGKYCLGERKRYQVCNTKECPDSSKSFHHQQCSEFDSVPYKGVLYKWEPISTPLTPCQLHCRPVNKFFSRMMKDIVRDGTRCKPGTKNMCISGMCKHVGCDWVIDSSAIEDRCGVCHGDGSSCITVKQHFNEKRGLGYVEATVIPSGSRNIRVEEVAEANNYLALKSDSGHYYLNGHWFIQWSGEYQAAGTVVYYKRIGNKESFNAIGPLKEPLHIMLLFQSNNPGVVFEYTVPNANSTQRKPEFFWAYEDWTHCTSSCGGGTQRIRVVCREVKGGVVEDHYCNVTNQPEDKQRSCNDHMCPARWWVGPWQHCSVTCGNNGIHRRSVICVRSLGPDEQAALEDHECGKQDKPEELGPCHQKQQCPGNITWSVGEWNQNCTHICDSQTRVVTCKHPTLACTEPKPIEQRPCSNVTCGFWDATAWTECTRMCGTGIQTRRVTCINGSVCRKKSPLAQRNCNTTPCPPPVTTASPTSTLKPLVSKSTKTIEQTNLVQTAFAQSTRPLSKQKSGSVKNITYNKKKEISNHIPLSIKKIPTDGNNQIKRGMKKYEHNQIEISNSKKKYTTNDSLASENIKESATNYSSESSETTENNIGLTNSSKASIVNKTNKEVSVDDTTTKSGEDALVETTSKSEGDVLAETGSGSDGTTVLVTTTTDSFGGVYYKWRQGQWSQCTKHCGAGIQNRTVQCIELELDAQIGEQYCMDQIKPNASRPCNEHSCSQWQVSQWGECSMPCGDGIQWRSVRCPKKHQCDPSDKPSQRQHCVIKPCLKWITGHWSQCTQSCGQGKQMRRVQCVNTTSNRPVVGCPLAKQPPSVQNCNLGHCNVGNAALKTLEYGCKGDRMNSKTCHLLKRMNKCEQRFIARVQCCKTCHLQLKASNRGHTSKSSDHISNKHV